MIKSAVGIVVGLLMMSWGLAGITGANSDNERKPPKCEPVDLQVTCEAYIKINPRACKQFVENECGDLESACEPFVDASCGSSCDNYAEQRCGDLLTDCGEQINRCAENLLDCGQQAAMCSANLGECLNTCGCAPVQNCQTCAKIPDCDLTCNPGALWCKKCRTTKDGVNKCKGCDVQFTVH